MAHDSDPSNGEAPLPNDLAAEGVSPAAARALWHALDPSAGRSAQRDAGASFDQVAQRLGTAERDAHSWCGVKKLPPARSFGTLLSRRQLPRRWGGIGLGAIVGVVVLGLSLRSSAPSTGSKEPRTYTTGTGQQANITFADGSRVTLAPQSVLTVEQFDTHARTVELNGEAHFDVPVANHAPFVVKTGAVSTRVLGTSFTVRRYAADPVARVLVSSGRVSVAPLGRSGRALTVSSGGIGVVADSGATTPDADVARYTEWMNGELVFRRAAAKDVFATLTRWYGYEFRFADPSIASDELTVGVSTRSSAEAFATIKLYLDVDLTFDGNVVTLSRHRRHVAPTRRSVDTLTSPNSEVGR